MNATLRLSDARARAAAAWFQPSPDPACRREQLAALYRAHRRAVLAFARRLGATPAEADDVCADVFVVALQRLPSFLGQSTPRTWLLGITRRVMADARRRASHRLELLVEPDDERAGDDLEAAVLEAERRASVRRLVTELPRRQREVVARYAFEGSTIASIAKATRAPVQTTYARLYAAQARLKDQLCQADGWR